MKPFTTIAGFWHNLPVFVRALLIGFIVTTAGAAPWTIMLALNVEYWHELPWAVPLTALYIWFFWKYVRGWGWPQSTAEERRKNCRAHDLSSEGWAAAIGAGILGLWALLLFQNVYSRMVVLPAQPAEDLSGIPLFTLFAWMIMGSVVAGVVEESGLRGYMQRPLEQHYGPVLAILVTGMMFGFMHLTHQEVTLVLMPWYIGASLVYGALAYQTKSILPSLVLHAGGDMLGTIQVFVSGRAEWQGISTPQPLIWETGTDATFWIAFLGFIAVTTFAIWAYSKLARIAVVPPAT